MKEVCEIISGGILLGAMFGLTAISLAVALYEFVHGWKIWRAKRHVAAMSAVAILAIIIGGTKPPTLFIQWDEGLHNNGSYIDTNDLRRVEVRWTYDAWIPNVATFTLSAIEIDTVNEDPTSNRLVKVATVPITDCALSAIMAREATNYLFFAEQSFIPDAPVVTNGVYHIKCVGGNNVWVPIGLKIYGDGETISPRSLPDGENYLEDLMNGDN